MTEFTPRAVRSLYLHVPFCAQKCDYCAFYSTAADRSLIQRYLKALIADLTGRRSSFAQPLSTVFFGGGTPSLLSVRQWETLLEAMHGIGVRGKEVGEWTVECNPATVSPDKARLLRSFGVNRISMGVQSLDDSLLDRLGRIHTRDMVFRSYEVLRNAGFENINLDLMFAIPGQTMETWQSTLNEVLALQGEHLSCYEVIYEEDTPLFARLQAGEFDVDEDLAAAMFDALVERAGENGLHQYEVANFARTRTDFQPDSSEDADLPAWACRHNVNYWRGGDYAAFGPSASGYEGGLRYRTLANTSAYCGAIEQQRPPFDWQERLPARRRAGEIAAFGLRMNAGWRWETFKKATGFDLRSEWSDAMNSLVERSWAVWEKERFRLTPTGLRFADAAGSEFLVSDEDVRPDEPRTDTQATILAGRESAAA